MQRVAVLATSAACLAVGCGIGLAHIPTSRGPLTAAAEGVVIMRTDRPDPVPTPLTVPVPKPHPAFDALQGEVAGLVQAAGASAGVSLVELGGNSPLNWSLNGDDAFVAASTYKLPLLMAEAEDIASGTVGASDMLCYEDEDWEDGTYADYSQGDCFARSELMRRVGEDSDNTAAHILVRYLGGSDVLNDYAISRGATASAFYDPNLTTANDLARLWVEAATGQAGGAAAEVVLYPLLVHTAYEDGIPAGVPNGAAVEHKVGFLDQEVNDAALVENGPDGPYVLAICTDGLGGDDAWHLVASISQAVWQFETERS